MKMRRVILFRESLYFVYYALSSSSFFLFLYLMKFETFGKKLDRDFYELKKVEVPFVKRLD